MRYLARHDVLSGALNRASFNELLNQAAWRHGEGGPGFAVLCIDLDGFKDVNDALGHAAGDRLLVEIAQRLRRVLPDNSVLARYGGDEFTLLPPGQWTTAAAEALAQKVLQVLPEPFASDGHRIYSGASLGIVLGRPGYDTPEQVLRDADTAMYRAKARGKSAYVIFDEAMHRAARERDGRERLSLDALPIHAFERQTPYGFAVPVPAGPAGALDVPLGRLMAFFMKAAVAAVPALLVLVAAIWLLGHGLQVLFPDLVKLKVLIYMPR